MIRNPQSATRPPLASLACLAGVMLVGCTTDTRIGLTIVQNQIPTANESGCSIPAKATESTLTSGTLDVALDRDYPYQLYPLIANSLSQFNPMVTSGDQNRIQVDRIHVRLQAPPGVDLASTPSCPTEFDSPLSSTLVLEPGGEASTLVEALLPCHAAQIRTLFQGVLPNGPSDQVVFRALVQARGKHGGTGIESNTFEFPIRVCAGCLQRGFTQTGFTRYDYPGIPLCEELPSNPYPGNACNIGQDALVLCCEAQPSDPSAPNQARRIECPARPR